MDIKIEYPRSEPTRNPGARKPSVGSVGGPETTPSHAGRLAGPIIFCFQHLTPRYPSAGVWLPNRQPEALGTIFGNFELIVREIEARGSITDSLGVRLTGSCKGAANPANLSTTSFIAVKI